MRNLALMLKLDKDTVCLKGLLCPVHICDKREARIAQLFIILVWAYKPWCCSNPSFVSAKNKTTWYLHLGLTRKLYSRKRGYQTHKHQGQLNGGVKKHCSYLHHLYCAKRKRRPRCTTSSVIANGFDIKTSSCTNLKFTDLQVTLYKFNWFSKVEIDFWQQKQTP